MTAYLTKLLAAFARRRLVRQPGVSVAGDAKVQAQRVGFRPGCRLQIGSGSIVEGTIAFEREGASICIGRNTYIGNSLLASADSISVGDDVLMAWGCGVVDHDSHSLDWGERRGDVRDWYHGRKDWTHVRRKPVRIGDKAWIGFNVVIVKGVTIGEGAVVAAGSVVTHDVEPYTLVGGNPAKTLRRLRDSA